MLRRLPTRVARVASVACVAVAGAAPLGCHSDAPTAPTAVATVTLAPGGAAGSAGGAVLEPGDSVRMTAEGRAAAGGVVAGAAFAWTSSAPEIATVDAAGWVRARGGGTAAITAVVTGAHAATTGAASGTLVVTVQPRARSLVLIVPDSVATGDTVHLRAVARDALGAPLPQVTFAWVAADTTVATIDAAGVLVARRVGPVSVIAAASGPADVLPPGGAVAPTARASLSIRLALADIAGGSYHTCGVARGGFVHCWGEGAWGRLGTGVAYGAWKTVAVPTAARTDVHFAVVAADGQQDSRSGHTCGVAAGGETYCWGSGAWGMLGDGQHGEDFPPPAAAVPTRVSGVPSVRAVALGGSHTCLLASAGDVWCAGRNYSGEIGAQPQGTTCAGEPCVLRFQPVAGARFRALVAGTHYNCGLTEAGEARCWGGGWLGELGTGVSEQRSTPTPVPDLRFQALAAGGSTTCGLAVDGTAYCWGSTYMGQVGSGASGNTDATLAPTRVAAPERFTRLAVGPWMHACALTQAGVAYCWGNNTHGQLGAETAETCGDPDHDGMTFLRGACSTRPVAVATSLRFTRLALGAEHSCGITATGATYCWGANDRGQLGTADTADRRSPTPVAVVR